MRPPSNQQRSYITVLRRSNRKHIGSTRQQVRTLDANCGGVFPPWAYETKGGWTNRVPVHPANLSRAKPSTRPFSPLTIP
jgi:hypothetical protein